jgi:hypothetical protein
MSFVLPDSSVISMDNLNEGSKPSLSFLARDKKILQFKKKTNYSTLRLATFYNQNKISARAA